MKQRYFFLGAKRNKGRSSRSKRGPPPLFSLAAKGQRLSERREAPRFRFPSFPSVAPSLRSLALNYLLSRARPPSLFPALFLHRRRLGFNPLPLTSSTVTGAMPSKGAKSPFPPSAEPATATPSICAPRRPSTCIAAMLRSGRRKRSLDREVFSRSSLVFDTREARSLAAIRVARSLFRFCRQKEEEFLLFGLSTALTSQRMRP